MNESHGNCLLNNQTMFNTSYLSSHFCGDMLTFLLNEKPKLVGKLQEIDLEEN